MTMISLIAAISENRVLGDGEKMLWHIPEDFKFFKATTMGKPIIMGRKTFDSIGRPLPGRPNIVITRNASWAHDNVITATSLDDAIKKAEKHDTQEIMVIGGGQIYAQALQFATRVYLTQIQGVYNGEALFPELPTADWREVSRKHGTECDTIGVSYDFVVYERK